MKNCKLLLLSVLVLMLVVSCSKKQEDAAKLEQEILTQDGALDSAGDSAAIGVMDDSIAAMPDVAAVPVEPSVKKMPGQPQGSGYTVQVAGCEDRAYAEHLIALYTGRGYEPFMVTATIDGQTVYRVRVGMFEYLSGAKALQAELLSKYSAKSWIDVVNESY